MIALIPVVGFDVRFDHVTLPGMATTTSAGRPTR